MLYIYQTTNYYNLVLRLASTHISSSVVRYICLSKLSHFISSIDSDDLVLCSDTWMVSCSGCVLASLVAENPNERSWWRRIDSNYRNSNDHMRAQVYEWRFTVPGFNHLPTSSFIGGSGWTRTNNVIDHGFTVRCVTNSAHWPISNLHYGLYHILLRLSSIFFGRV